MYKKEHAECIIIMSRVFLCTRYKLVPGIRIHWVMIPESTEGGGGKGGLNFSWNVVDTYLFQGPLSLLNLICEVHPFRGDDVVTHTRPRAKKYCKCCCINFHPWWLCALYRVENYSPEQEHKKAIIFG